MNHSRAGSLKEAFIIEAIAYYSNEVIKDTSDWGNSFISKSAWQLCANECLDAIEERHNR